MAAAAMDGCEVDDSVNTFGGWRRGAPKCMRWRTGAGLVHTSAEEVCYGPANGDGTGGVQARRRPCPADMRQVLIEMPIRIKLAGSHGFKLPGGHSL
jgi:hypothetical protein